MSRERFAPGPLICRAEEDDLLRMALLKLARPTPSTKGMDPKARAQRLHAELERRIKIAITALNPSLPAPPQEPRDG